MAGLKGAPDQVAEPDHADEPLRLPPQEKVKPVATVLPGQLHIPLQQNTLFHLCKESVLPLGIKGGKESPIPSVVFGQGNSEGRRGQP